MVLYFKEDSKGKRNLLASTKMNVENFVSIEPFTQQEFKDLEMKSVSSKVKSASLSFTLAAQFLKEGKATYVNLKLNKLIIHINWH